VKGFPKKSFMKITKLARQIWRIFLTVIAGTIILLLVVYGLTAISPLFFNMTFNTPEILKITLKFLLVIYVAIAVSLMLGYCTRFLPSPVNSILQNHAKTANTIFILIIWAVVCLYNPSKMFVISFLAIPFIARVWLQKKAATSKQS